MGWSIRDMWADYLDFLYVVLDSICKTFTSFQHILWLSAYACWDNFDFSLKSCVRLYLCILLKVCLFHRCNICHSHMGCCTHCFIRWASLTSPVFSSVPRSVYLALKMVLRFKRFPMCPNFSEMPLTYGMKTVTWSILSQERRFLLMASLQSQLILLDIH
jgi:hypothetical protein